MFVFEHNSTTSRQVLVLRTVCFNYYIQDWNGLPIMLTWRVGRKMRIISSNQIQTLIRNKEVVTHLNQKLKINYLVVRTFLNHQSASVLLFVFRLHWYPRLKFYFRKKMKSNLLINIMHEFDLTIPLMMTAITLLG